jgi:hypothetical protein
METANGTEELSKTERGYLDARWRTMENSVFGRKREASGAWDEDGLDQDGIAGDVQLVPRRSVRRRGHEMAHTDM